MTDKPILFSPSMVLALLDGRKTMTRRVLQGVPDQPETDCHPNHTAKHSAPYLDAYCNMGRTAWNPRGMSTAWCWWQVDDRMCLPTFRVKHAPGDRLYVREAWRALDIADAMSPATIAACYATESDRRALIAARFEADAVERGTREGDNARRASWGRIRAGMHMPRCLSRSTLIVSRVRVERVQEITAGDAIAEGLAAITKDGKLVKYGIPDRDGLPGNDNLGWPWAEWEVDPREAFRKLWDSINAGRGFGWNVNPWVSVTEFSVIPQNIDLIE